MVWIITGVALLIGVVACLFNFQKEGPRWRYFVALLPASLLALGAVGVLKPWPIAIGSLLIGVVAFVILLREGAYAYVRYSALAAGLVPLAAVVTGNGALLLVGYLGIGIAVLVWLRSARGKAGKRILAVGGMTVAVATVVFALPLAGVSGTPSRGDNTVAGSAIAASTTSSEQQLSTEQPTPVGTGTSPDVSVEGQAVWPVDLAVNSEFNFVEGGLTGATASEKLLSLLEAAQVKPYLLATQAYAAGLWDDPNKVAPLITADSQAVSVEGMALHAKLVSFYEAADVQLGQANPADVNTSFSSVGVTGKAGITGNLEALVAKKDDVTVVTLTRCGNATFKPSPRRQAPAPQASASSPHQVTTTVPVITTITGSTPSTVFTTPSTVITTVPYTTVVTTSTVVTSTTGITTTTGVTTTTGTTNTVTTATTATETTGTTATVTTGTTATETTETTATVTTPSTVTTTVTTPTTQTVTTPSTVTTTPTTPTTSTTTSTPVCPYNPSLPPDSPDCKEPKSTETSDYEYPTSKPPVSSPPGSPEPTLPPEPDPIDPSITTEQEAPEIPAPSASVPTTPREIPDPVPTGAQPSDNPQTSVIADPDAGAAEQESAAAVVETPAVEPPAASAPESDAEEAPPTELTAVETTGASLGMGLPLGILLLGRMRGGAVRRTAPQHR